MKSVGIGQVHTCAVRIDDTVACWGARNTETNISDHGQTTVPGDLGPVKQLSVGEYHTCAVKLDDTLVCWGPNWYGENNLPADLGKVASISAGYGATCAIRLSDHGLECWGYSGFGQSQVPLGLGPVESVSTMYSTTCAVKPDHTLACWGDNQFGESDAPAGEFAAISSGVYHNCALALDGAVSCFGEPIATWVPAADTTPPNIVPTQGTGWYRSDVTLSWWVYDYESGMWDKTGCGDVTVSDDTEGNTYTCTATSDGGTSTENVTIRRDTVAPSVDITDCPSGVRQFADASIHVTMSDAGSGLAGDVRDTRQLPSGKRGSQTYTVTATDLAGNTATATCDYEVRAIAPVPAAPTMRTPNRGAFTVSWKKPINAEPGAQLRYRLERRDVNDSDWTTVADDITALTYSATDQPEGTWFYRVVAGDGIVEATPSPASAKIVVDRTPPAKPKLSNLEAKPDYINRTTGHWWYRDSIQVGLALTATPADPDLPDGTPGSGVAPFTANWLETTAGLRTVRKSVSDAAGNVSPDATLVIALDAYGPAVTATCPSAPVARNAVAYATYDASDPALGPGRPGDGPRAPRHGDRGRQDGDGVGERQRRPRHPRDLHDTVA